MGNIALSLLSSLYLQSNSDVASRVLFPFARSALVRRAQDPSVRRPRAIRSIGPPPEWILHADAEGSEGRSALIFLARCRDKGASLLKLIVSCDNQASERGANFIFAFELFSVVSDMWCVEGVSPDSSVAVYFDSDSAAPVPTKGGPIAH